MFKQRVKVKLYYFDRNYDGKQQPGATNQMHLNNWSSTSVSISIKKRFWQFAGLEPSGVL